MVEGLEQAGAPCVPKFGVGAADVGNGKQVECVEVFACGNTAAEGLEDVRILDVFFLGNGGHEQVVFNQPCEEVAFFFGVVVVGGELLCVFDAFFGVIAATAFGDVVQQGGGVEDMRSWICLHDGAGLGHLVAVGFDGETAHIADDGQDVVVYGVNMEEVVLEQAGDFFPCREIAAKYTVEVEKTEGLGKAGAVFEELDEAAAVFWILGETGVDFSCGRPPCTQGLRLDGGDVLLLHGLDDGEDVFGILLEQGKIVGGDLVADAFVAAVDGVDMSGTAGGLMVFENRNEDAVELFDGFGGAVESVHQGFASAADVGLGIA
mgnify:FL=1